jgi:hypothetical protein
MPLRRWGALGLKASLLGLVVLGGARAETKDEVEARMHRDIKFLAADECEGRGVDTKGIARAADYIAAAFKKAGLKPAGAESSYFQAFKIAGPPKLEGVAVLRLRGPKGEDLELKAGTDFEVLGLSGSGKLTAPLVFAGFGITADAEKYDDYKDKEVENKVVVLLRKAPRYDDPMKPFGGNRKDEYASFVSKLSNAEKHKVAAVLIVNDAGEAAKGDKLLKFSDLGMGVSPAPIPALQVRRELVDQILASTLNTDLGQLQKAIESDLKPRGGPLTGWTASIETHVGRTSLAAKNVVGVLEGSGPLAKETIVVGAHYDHLGYGGAGSGSRNPNAKEIHHGADDNGSGTTTILELARRFGKMREREGRRLVFMAFSGEERGLLGSAYYCNQNPRFPLADTAAMVNLDMVGRLRDDEKTKKGKLLAEGVGTAKEFDHLLDAVNKKYDFSLKKSKSFIPNSDHASFYRKKVPVVFLWTGMHPDYHLPADTADKINVAGMRRVADFTEDVVMRLAADPERPQYVKVEVISGSGKSSIPLLGFTPGNYGETETGVLVAEVRKDGAAAKGGVIAGDMIVSIAGQPIRNMGNYMTIMTQQRRGQPLEVGILRDGKNLTLKVIPQ